MIEFFSKEINNAPVKLEKDLILMIKKAEDNGHSFINPKYAKMLQFLTNKKVKFTTEWTKYNNKYFIGQMNKKHEPHGICRLIHKDGLSMIDGKFVNGSL